MPSQTDFSIYTRLRGNSEQNHEEEGANKENMSERKAAVAAEGKLAFGSVIRHMKTVHVWKTLGV